ncbi:MAG TPA: HD domain-containing protein [Usitatibacter sp.]|jgi:putative hydrolase of HD superfamily|nr:HD domain-containing protein [Usitatibacter sp.]
MPQAGDLASIVSFLTELDRLKLVYRKSYVRDLSRHENSAEHSWHLAIALLTFAPDMKLPIDVAHAVEMALVHDVCEIDGGDVSVYDPNYKDKEIAERACVDRLAGFSPAFAKRMRELWLEYEAQETLESRWVRVFDRLMPFIVNLATQGRTWREQGIRKSQVLKVHEPIRVLAPDIFTWMASEIDESVRRGWLVDA